MDKDIRCEQVDDEPAALYSLVELVRYLRSEDGCPWDRAQSAAGFARFTVGEAKEFCEATNSGDDEHAAEECGDCLFTIFAAIAAAEDEGRFSLSDVVVHARDKLMRRHAHVFSDEKAATIEEAIESWDKIKSSERADRD